MLLHLLILAGTALPVFARSIVSFDRNWRFTMNDERGAEVTDYNDKQWRKLNVPHDWSIEGPFAAEAPGAGTIAFLPTGVGWYRKYFTLARRDVARSLFIEFDGIMADSDVSINGVHLGKRPYGYVSFRYELTGHLNFGEKPNVLAVRVNNDTQPASRWYTGSGIYRHVRLVMTDPVHLDHWGVFVSTSRSNGGVTTARVQSTVINQSKTNREVTVRTALTAPDGKTLPAVEVRGTIPAGQSKEIEDRSLEIGKSVAPVAKAEPMIAMDPLVAPSNGHAERNGNGHHELAAAVTR